MSAETISERMRFRLMALIGNLPSVYPNNIEKTFLIGLSIDRFIKDFTKNGDLEKLIAEKKRNVDPDSITLRRLRGGRNYNLFGDADVFIDGRYGIVITNDHPDDLPIRRGAVVSFDVKYLYQHPDYIESDTGDVYSAGDVIIKQVQGLPDQPSDSLVFQMRWERFLYRLVGEWAKSAGFSRVCVEWITYLKNRHTEMNLDLCELRYDKTPRRMGFHDLYPCGPLILDLDRVRRD